MKDKNKKILEGILKNNPKLKKKDLIKTIEVLKSIKPNVKISKKFSKKLKKRISWIIKLKKTSKKSYIQIFFYIFTWVFSLFWFFYIFSDNLFILDKDITDFQNINIDETIKIEDFETSVERQWKEKRKNINNQISKEKKLENDTNKNDRKWKIKINTNKKIKKDIKIKVLSKFTKKQKIDKKTDIRKNKLNKETIVVQKTFLNDTIDVFIEDTVRIPNKNLNDSNDNINFTEKANLYWSFWFSTNIMNSDLETSNNFLDYCNKIWWRIFMNNLIKYCLIKENKCSEQEYNIGKCNGLFGIENDKDLNVKKLMEEFKKENLLEEE